MKAEYYHRQHNLVRERLQKAIKKQFWRVVITRRRSDAAFAKWNPEELELGTKFPVSHDGHPVKTYNRDRDIVGLNGSSKTVLLGHLQTFELVQLLRQLEATEQQFLKS